MLIPCSYDEREKTDLLHGLMHDLRTITDARWRMRYFEDRDNDEFRRRVDGLFEELCAVISREYFEHYELAPIEH